MPRWLAALRTQVLTGLAAIRLILVGGLIALMTGGLIADLDLSVTKAIRSVGWPRPMPLLRCCSLVGDVPCDAPTECFRELEWHTPPGHHCGPRPTSGRYSPDSYLNEMFSRAR